MGSIMTKQLPVEKEHKEMPRYMILISGISEEDFDVWLDEIKVNSNNNYVIAGHNDSNFEVTIYDNFAEEIIQGIKAICKLVQLKLDDENAD